MLDAMFGMFIHANINVKLGKLKYIFNSPELHLWHHANYREVFHANFSTKFAVWDYLSVPYMIPVLNPVTSRKTGACITISQKIIFCSMLFR